MTIIRALYVWKHYIGHTFGGLKLTNLLKRKVQSCHSCQEQSISATAPIHLWKNTMPPCIRVYLDYVEPFMGKMFLIILDYCSKWTEAHPMSERAERAWTCRMSITDSYEKTFCERLADVSTVICR